MALDKSTFETLVPSRFVTFTFPNPSSLSASGDRRLLRVAVLDSPIQPTPSPRVAAMLVPSHREHDWIFSTEPGHLQLLLSSPGLSRLILIGEQPADGRGSALGFRRQMECERSRREGLEESLKPLVLALSPRICFEIGVPEVTFLSYEDNLVASVTLEVCIGEFVGEMLVEDVEIERGSGCGEREFRRRLRFKRMPNLVQTQVRIVPRENHGETEGGFRIEEMQYRIDARVLVHPYLAPMVASLSLIGFHIDERIRKGLRPKAFCAGVGGGALLAFLSGQLGFEVLGVDVDEMVLRVAKQYFGLEDGDFLRVVVGDAIEWIERVASWKTEGTLVAGYSRDLSVADGMDGKFDVIMVDLDSSDASTGLVAPPLEFVRKPVLLAARSLLCEFGILVINVIPPDRFYYGTMINEVRDVFHDLYEIDVGNGENFVLIATVASIRDCSAYDVSFIMKLNSILSGAYMDSIRKI
ncbi:eEF1A lysine and N-terminal methyltransferase [Rhodamnia argentea]|uniref:EEF1A lysine and N-terminal methyltransferase n=1 Tax=Rhodamnia argentea TaxID=178133 RepID=A0ABM3HER8_9MYRT|nr:eEF1A lysine and N-terminal methyltransferase [Rhodamnia argentea]